MTLVTYRAAKDFVKRCLVRPAFEMFQRVGVNVTPAHFYSEIPRIAELRATTSWREPYDLSALHTRAYVEQLALLEKWLSPHLARAVRDDVWQRAIASQGSEGYGPVEAHVLYCFAAAERPRRVLQVGCGVSTAVLLQALCGHAGTLQNSPEITCVEPFPSDYLHALDKEGRIDLVVEKAQDWDPSPNLAELREGDLLFVDSTHTTVPGSDANRIILEWLPSLSPGVWVHFHDIYFPYDYAPGILTRNLFFGRESLLLQAFLSCNRRFRVAASLSLLHHERQEALRNLLSEIYRPRAMNFGVEEGDDGHFPSSTYIRCVEPRTTSGDLS